MRALHTSVTHPMTALVRRFQPQGATLAARLAGMPLASFRRRAAAILVDGVLLGILVAVLGVTVRGSGRIASGEAEISFELGGLLVAVFAVLYFGVSTWLGGGRTLGKRLSGIRVVPLVHEHLSLWHCIERSLGYSASSLEGGFGFLQYYKHVNAQTVHDRIAETIVVRDPKPVPPRSV
jgi:uncharacterized RDD family membrane protein YckC